MEDMEQNKQEVTSLLLDDEFLEGIFSNKPENIDLNAANDILEYAELNENIPGSDVQQEAESAQPKVVRNRGKKEKKNGWQKDLLLYIHDLAYLLSAIIVIFLLCFRIVVVSGTSMYSTLCDGDYLLLLGNVFYTEPKSGDIIVACKESFKDGEPIVKRVIATEGQVIDIDFSKGIVFVDGVAIDEPYVYSATFMDQGMKFPATVPDGCVFVMGDNRMASMDSRDPQIGFVDEREILGKVLILFLPGTNDGENPRDFDRIGVVS